MTHRAHPASGRDGEVRGIRTPEQKQRGDLGRRDGQHQSRTERVSRLRRPPGWYCPLGQKPSTARRGETGPPTAPTVATVADSAAALNVPAQAPTVPSPRLGAPGYARQARRPGNAHRLNTPAGRPVLGAPGYAPPAIANRGRLAHNAAPRSRTSCSSGNLKI